MAIYRTHQEALVSIINEVNGKSVPFSSLTVGPPGPSDVEERPELTTIRLGARPNTDYKGFVVARYKKLTLAQMLAALGITHFVLPSAAASTRYLAEDIRRVYKINIFEADIVDEPIPYAPNGTANLTITAAPGSYVYAGQAPVIIGPAHLAEVIQVTTLSGFNYPAV